MSFPELFELVEVLDITRPPEQHSGAKEASGEEDPLPSDKSKSLLEGVRQDIMHVCLKDYGEMNVLVLYCKNGHLLYRLGHANRPTKFRIVRYYS